MAAGAVVHGSCGGSPGVAACLRLCVYAVTPVCRNQTQLPDLKSVRRPPPKKWGGDGTPVWCVAPGRGWYFTTHVGAFVGCAAPLYSDLRPPALRDCDSWTECLPLLSLRCMRSIFQRPGTGAFSRRARVTSKQGRAGGRGPSVKHHQEPQVESDDYGGVFATGTISRNSWTSTLAGYTTRPSTPPVSPASPTDSDEKLRTKAASRRLRCVVHPCCS